MVNSLKSLLSEEIINTGRQQELDIAKGLAIIFMIWQHVLGLFETNCWWYFEDIGQTLLSGPFAAPVFMFAMGMGMVFSHRNSAKDWLLRGLDLYLIGFVLNLFRWVIPEAIRAGISGTAFDTTVLYLLLQVDILEFAGLAFAFMGLMKMLKVPAKVVIIITVLCSLMGNIPMLHFNSPVLADLVGLFVPTNGETTFPFTVWIVFVVAGYYFGKLYQRIGDKRAFFRIVTPVSLLLTLPYIGWSFYWLRGMFRDEYSFFFMNSFQAAVILVLIPGWLGTLYFLFDNHHGIIVRFLCDLSKNINSVYVLQWTIIGFVSTLCPFVLNRITEIIGVLAILFAAYAGSVIWVKYLKPIITK